MVGITQEMTRTVGVVALALMSWCASGIAETAEQNAGLEPAVAEASPAAASGPADLPAQLFVRKCIGCHTIGGGALSGPDVKPTAHWPRADLEAAIVRMEKNVGPMSAEEVDALTEFLLQPNAAERLSLEQDRVAMQQAAQLEPPSPELGRALFHGKEQFVNGGAACSGCHQADGYGGNLAASLSDAATRLGKASVTSTIEAPGFPIMRAIYQQHPVTKQEATHLMAYLEEVAAQPTQQAGTIPLHAIGLVGAIAFMAAVGMGWRNRPAGTRARLVSNSRSRTRRDAA
jgi:mono/diheme cytochrome c family protein